MTTETVWIPPSALANLTEELAGLTALPYPDKTATDRIHELRRTLRQAEASVKPDDGLVEPGMRITALLSGDSRATVFLLGDRASATLDDEIGVDVYSPTSPLGQAIIGSQVGDVVTYRTPSNLEISVEILAAVPYTG